MKRGRRSAAELSMAPIVEVISRPAAPDHLTDDEASIWEGFVSGMRADYFRRGDFDTLANLCRHIHAARRVSQWIEMALSDPEIGIEVVDRLMRMRQRETAQANALARSLRLTKQAQSSPKGAGGATVDGTLRKPWEISAAEADE
jgi:hypothetical protein